MKDYYISINGEQSGPFTIEELKEKKLTDEYLVWNEAFEKWLKPSEVFHLKESIVKLPPPLPDKKFGESKAIRKALRDSSIIFIIELIINFLAFGGLRSQGELNSLYPEWANLQMSEIVDYIILMSLAISITITLLTLIIDYRIRIIKEIKRLNV